MQNIVHLADDEKFINSANWQFEKSFPAKNIFYILTNKPTQDLQYVERKENIRIRYQKKILSILSELGQEKTLVVIHGLNYYKSKFVLNAPKNFVFIWNFFGGEIYNDPNIYKAEIYGKLTKQFFFSKRDKWNSWLVRPYYLLKYRSLPPYRLIEKASKRIAYFGILYLEDLNLISETLQQSFKHFKYSYYPLEFLFKEDTFHNLRVSDNNILVGNSSAPTNNHLEVFTKLSAFDLGDKKIIVPLSYGDKEYADKVIEFGKNKLGTNLEPITDFMALADYNTLLGRCGVSIFNNYRQQAVGNVLSLIWMGSKVFLDERNTLFHYLKRIGITVFSVQKDLKVEDKQVFDLLDEPTVLKNREILFEEIGSDRILKNLENQILTILNA